MVEVSLSGGGVETVLYVVVSKGFWISGVLSCVVFEVCRDVETVRFAFVTEVLKADIGVVGAGEVNFVVLMVSEAVCELLLDIIVGVVVFSVTFKVSEALGVSVLKVREVRGDETSIVGEVPCVLLMIVETGSTCKVLTLVGSLLEVDDKVWLTVGIVVVLVSGTEDSVGWVVVEVTERDAEIEVVCTVVRKVGLSVLPGALVVLLVDTSGIEEEEDVVNVVMVSNRTGVTADEVSFSVVGMRVVGVAAVVLDSGIVLIVDDVETAGTLKVEIAEDDVDVIAVLGGVNGGTTTGLMPKNKRKI